MVRARRPGSSRLSDQVAIVTGAGQGIGQAIAELFAAEGASVIIADVKRDTGRMAVAKIRKTGAIAEFVECDVASEASVQNMIDKSVQRFRKIHVLINNAGVGLIRSVPETTLEQWRQLMAVDLDGSFLCSKYALPHIIQAGGGSIINMASVHALATMPNFSGYASAKGAILALTRSLAIDYGKHKVRVNAILPGCIQTPTSDEILEKLGGQQKKMVDHIKAHQCLPELGHPREVAAAALFLASNEASFITGTLLVVDGGLTAKLTGWPPG